MNTTASKQHELKEFVSREVSYCVSSLVYELSKDEKYMEDLFPVLSQPPAFNPTPAKHLCEGCEEEKILDINHQYCEECFEESKNDLDPVEAYEHWIVTDWFAGKLEAKGEMVLRDFLGLTIWGRTCTGQAIALDGVIEEIYDDLHSKAK